MAKTREFRDIIYPNKIADMPLEGKAYVTFVPKIVQFMLNKEKLKNSLTGNSDKKQVIIDRLDQAERIIYAEQLIDPDGKIVRSITLPINKVRDTLKSNYKLINGLDLLASGEFFKWSLANFTTIMKMGGNALNMFGGNMAGNALGGIANILSSAPEEWKALGRSIIGNGYMENPHDMMIYDGVERRTFGVTYNLMKPQNAEEEKDLKLIREIFRATQIGNYKDDVWSVSAPATWFISFTSYGSNINDQQTSIDPFLNYYNCGLVDSTFNFGDTSQNVNFSRTPSGEPIYDMSLSFIELEKMGTKSWDENVKFVKNNYK
jgi:hypothetical protein